jgi:hypothetical protein
MCLFAPRHAAKYFADVAMADAVERRDFNLRHVFAKSANLRCLLGSDLAARIAFLGVVRSVLYAV